MRLTINGKAHIRVTVEEAQASFRLIQERGLANFKSGKHPAAEDAADLEESTQRYTELLADLKD